VRAIGARRACFGDVSLQIYHLCTTGTSTGLQQAIRDRGYFGVFSATTKHHGFTVGTDDLLRRRHMWPHTWRSSSGGSASGPYAVEEVGANFFFSPHMFFQSSAKFEIVLLNLRPAF
jgi:hypothetical protein